MNDDGLVNGKFNLSHNVRFTSHQTGNDAVLTQMPKLELASNAGGDGRC